MYLGVGIKAFQLFRLSEFSTPNETFLEAPVAALVCA